MGKERFREVFAELPSPDHLRHRAGAGWSLVAIEWERPAAGGEEGEEWEEEIPYGLMVAPDGARLMRNPAEVHVMTAALNLIVDDCPLSQVAVELNRRGHETRQGEAWTAVAVFNLLPRMIQAGPRIFSSEEWADRRRRLPKVG